MTSTCSGATVAPPTSSRSSVTILARLTPPTPRIGLVGKSRRSTPSARSTSAAIITRMNPPVLPSWLPRSSWPRPVASARHSIVPVDTVDQESDAPVDHILEGSAMTRLKWAMAWWLILFSAALGPSAASAQAPTVDGLAIDPDAELVVAMPDDTNNMDPRIGMGSIRSSYIRQVYESMID